MGAVQSSTETKTSSLARLPGDASTGDILLFRTRNVTGCCIRAVQQWDHVAMILRTETGLQTVEFTSSGLGCWRLPDRLEDPEVISCSLRRLQGNVTNLMINNLNNYLRYVENHPYRVDCTVWSSRLLWCCNSTHHEPTSYMVATHDELIDPQRDDESNGETATSKSVRKSQVLRVPTMFDDPAPSEDTLLALATHKGYCCSSFVASCLMAMGMLSLSPNCDTYLLEDLGDGKELPFLYGGLGPEVVVKGEVPLDIPETELQDRVETRPETKYGNLLGHSTEANTRSAHIVGESASSLSPGAVASDRDEDAHDDPLPPMPFPPSELKHVDPFVLPSAVWQMILCYCAARDVLSCAQTCTTLNQLSEQVFRAKCEDIGYRLPIRKRRRTAYHLPPEIVRALTLKRPWRAMWLENACKFCLEHGEFGFRRSAINSVLEGWICVRCVTCDTAIDFLSAGERFVDTEGRSGRILKRNIPSPRKARK